MARGTALRNVRVSDEVWTAAREQAEANGETVSDVVRNALALYLDTDVRSLLTNLLDANDGDEGLETLGATMETRERAYRLLGLT